MRIVHVLIFYYAQSTTHVDSAWLTMPMASTAHCLYLQHSASHWHSTRALILAAYTMCIVNVLIFVAAYTMRIVNVLIFVAASTQRIVTNAQK